MTDEQDETQEGADMGERPDEPVIDPAPEDEDA